MKKFLSVLGLLLGLFVCVTLFSACGGDDDEGIQSNPLVGTWRAEITSNGKVYKDLSFTSYYKFSATNQDAETDKILDVIIGTYSVDNNIVNINADGFGTSAFQINGNELTFSEWDKGIVYKKIVLY